VLGVAKICQLFASKAGPDQKTVHYARLQHEKGLIVTLHANQKLTERGFHKVSDSEYLYKGNRYDVVARKKISHGIKIQLRQDKLEEGLLAFLQSFFHPINNMQAPAGQSQKILTQGVIKSLLPIKGTSHVGDKLHYYFTLSACIFPDRIYLPTHCPPPQFG